MKKAIYNLTVIFPLLFGIIGCESDSPVEPGLEFDFNAVINSYTENVILKTYSDLKVNTEALQTACENFNNNPTQQNLNVAANAWYAARVPWEQSEAFLFGPVSFLSIDPSMDSWPVDETQLQNVLNSSFDLTPEFVRNGLGYSLRGFHTLEYFLFHEGEIRDASTITERGKLYMTSVAVVLAEDAAALYNEWQDGFAVEFKKAGQTGSRYSSVNQAVQEIVEGIITIVDEVGNGKISEPYVTKDVLTVESQYSWNSLTDFSNNIIGVKTAYTSGSGTGLDKFVKSKNLQLNDRIINEIDDVIGKISAIPEPFRNNLNASVQIQAAINACNVLLETFVNDVKPLIAQ